MNNLKLSVIVLFDKLIEEKELGQNQLAYIDDLRTQLLNEKE